MEITLEKIELVKDRTGVSYKEAKEALEAVDGSVVDAIIAIEETVNLKTGNKASELADDTIEKVKELVKKGNITKIAVKKDDETLVNIPLNVGLVGALVAPWGIIAATIAAFGFKCQIELTKDDGTVIDVSQKAEVIASDVKEKGSVVMDEVARKGSAVYEDLKANAPDKMVELKEKGIGMILITHDIYTAINTSDRIAILYLGYVIEITDTKNFSGTGEKLLHPYTRSLYKALPETDFELTEGHQPSYLHIPKGCPYHENCPRQVRECHYEIPELRELNGSVIRCFNPLVDGE